MTKSPESHSVEHLLAESRRFPPQPHISEKSHLGNFDYYLEMYRESIYNSDAFWLEQAETLEWFRKPTTACKCTWELPRIEHTWFEDGQLNVTVNCLDRHLKTKNRDKPAFIWQGDAEADQSVLTYEELYEKVCRFANVLKAHGIGKGDRVCIYLPMIP